MIRLASPFTSGAVLQRDMPLPVWGKTAPGTLVHAICGAREAYGRSSSTGEFTVYLPPLPAGGPLDLTVSAGGETLTLHDILVGEVWIAGGQSNMEYRLNSNIAHDPLPPGELSLGRIQEKEFVDSIRDPEMVRSLQVPRVISGAQENSFTASWRKMTREEAPGFSAVGAWFAKTVQEKLNIPVGIIECNWGGSIAEAWTSRGALMHLPETAAHLREADEHFRKKEAWEKTFSAITGEELAKFGMLDPGNQGFAKGWAAPELNDDFWKEMQVPGSWIQQKISGNGALWARGVVTIPDSWAGHPLILHLAPVDKHDTTYFNGVEIGHTGKGCETEYWNMPRHYPVPAEMVKAGRAVIAIRAYSFMYDGSIAGGKLENPETGECLSLPGIWKAFAESDLGYCSPNQFSSVKFHLGNPNIPATLFNALLHPLIPYAVRGVIWYQGESDADRMPDARAYYDKLRNMIGDWRTHWGQGDFPFIQMLLAGYRQQKSFSAEEIWPVLREAQLKLCQDMPEVYAASAIDIGETADIHPQNKKDAGLRMARVALSGLYHVPGIVAGGPRLQKHTVTGNLIRLFFENAGALAFRGGEAKGFVFLDSGKNILPPDSIAIDRDTLVLTCREGSLPLELYYNWADHPDGTLENGEGLPADPFHIWL